MASSRKRGCWFGKGVGPRLANLSGSGSSKGWSSRKPFLCCLFIPLRRLPDWVIAIQLLFSCMYASKRGFPSHSCLATATAAAIACCRAPVSFVFFPRVPCLRDSKASSRDGSLFLFCSLWALNSSIKKGWWGLLPFHRQPHLLLYAGLSLISLLLLYLASHKVVNQASCPSSASPLHVMCADSSFSLIPWILIMELLIALLRFMDSWFRNEKANKRRTKNGIGIADQSPVSRLASGRCHGTVIGS